MLPLVLYLFLIPDPTVEINIWGVLGIIGAFIVGIGLFNLVAIMIRQYLGHLVTILSFLIGGLLMAISLHFL